MGAGRKAVCTDNDVCVRMVAPSGGTHMCALQTLAGDLSDERLPPSSRLATCKEDWECPKKLKRRFLYPGQEKNYLLHLAKPRSKFDRVTEEVEKIGPPYR